MSLPQLVHDARTAPAVKRDRLIRLQEVLRIAGVGKSTWYSLAAQGLAPRCVKITPRCVAWSENAVLSWVQARLQEAAGEITDLGSQGNAQ